MNHFISNAFKILGRMVLACTLLAPAVPTWAQTSPFATLPLLSVPATTKPNLLLLMDNSGSMGYTYVPDDFRISFSNNISATWAYQSPDANRLYYDPRILYAPRVLSNGTPMATATEATALARTSRWQNSTVGNQAPGIFYKESCTTELGAASSCNNFTGFAMYIGTAPANNQFSNTLTFYLCNASTGGVCTTTTQAYHIPPASGSVTFATNAYPAKPTARTDCVSLPTRCSWQEERTNALNWSLYYSTRMEAAKTSIGIAFQDPSFANSFRLGYGWMNQNGDGRTGNGNVEPLATMIRRGVRPFLNNPSEPAGSRLEKDDFYTWLYGLNPNGSTESNQLLHAAGLYFSRGDNGGPWHARPKSDTVTQPVDTSGTGLVTDHLSCRRAAAIMFSDGAYSDNTYAVGRPGNVDNGDFTGLSFTTHSKLVNGVTTTFNFSTVPTLNAPYVTYRDGNSGSMADRAASFWIQDLRPNLNDNVPTVDGNPAYWQHMVFYSIGLGIRGSVTPAQIAQYRSDYVRGIVPTPLNWGAPGAFGSINNINDFIHAAYSSQGKSFSVRSPKEIKDSFVDAIANATQAGGSNAGVAVSDGDGNLSTLGGELKYVPSYNILDSIGDIKAFPITGLGNVININSPTWVASLNIPTTRTMVTSSGVVPSVSGVDLTTTFSALPADVRTALGSNANNSYLSYLRGAPSGVNASGQTLRLRNSLMGTAVNSPPSYVRGTLNMGYGLTTTLAPINFDGRSKYGDFLKAKRNYTLGVLFSATNDGVVHALNPSFGTETMAFMPRSALPKVDEFSQDPYTHKYILDGPVTEGDVFTGNDVTGSWSSMVFGSGGRGGQYVYALKLPPPPSITPTTIVTPVLSRSNVQWEINNTTPGFANLGYVLNPVQSGFLRNERRVAVFTSGYDNVSGVASLFVVDALTGELIQEISTLRGTAANKNGMGGVTLVRKDRFIVAAIAGDDQGNMWKFDLRTDPVLNGATRFRVGFNGNPFFTSIGNRPFSGEPAWRNPSNALLGTTPITMLVVAATGRINTDTDVADTGSQAIYGVWDRNVVGEDETFNTNGFGVLADTQLVLQTRSALVTSFGGANFYNVSEKDVDYTPNNKIGWKLELDFAPGQRNIGPILNFNQTVVIATVVPSATTLVESCTVSDALKSYVYQLDAETGGSAQTNGIATGLPGSARTRGRYSFGNGSGFIVNGAGLLGNKVSIAEAAGFARNNALSERAIGPQPEDQPKEQLEAPCNSASENVTLLGVGATALQLVSSCSDGRGYRRTWRQLINPPRIN